MDVPFQAKRANSLFFCLFVVLPSTDWMIHTHIGEGIFFTQLLTQVLISSRNTLTDTPRNNILPATLASLSPVKLTTEINHHAMNAAYHSQKKKENILFLSLRNLYLVHYTICILNKMLGRLCLGWEAVIMCGSSGFVSNNY